MGNQTMEYVNPVFNFIIGLGLFSTSGQFDAILSI